MLVETIHSKFPQLYPVYSPENSEILIMRLYLRNEITKKSNDLLTSIEDLIEKLKKTVIRGLSNVIATEIVEYITSYVADDGSIAQRKVYAIETRGVNLANAISMPFIDQYEVHCNSMRDIAQVYGIEAAREKIISELKTLNEATVTKGQAFAHFSIYADEMTSMGVLTSIQRNGVGKREHDNIMLMLCTATPLQVLEEAALKGATDNIQGVSAMLMIGQTPNYGTRFNSITLDEEFIRSQTASVSSVLDAL
jgi:DNA-directed RNA polymerase beta' subunit